MNTKKTDYLLIYYTIQKKRALKNLDLIDEIRRNEITLEEINKKIVFSISDLPDHFSLLEVESEIEKNILEIKDENSLLQYFYYLIKIHHKLKGITSGTGEEMNYLKKRYNAIEGIVKIDPFQSKFNSTKELISFCYLELNAVFASAIQFFTILKGEFGFKVEDWKEKIVNNIELPSFFEIKSMFNLETASKEFSKNEPAQVPIQNNSKDKLSHKQQILLLDKLGVFETPEIVKLNATEKGKLFSFLLNRDEKNTYDYIRNKDATKNSVSMDKNFVKTESNLERVNEILKEIGLEK